jgi:hypothetical protein
MGIRNFKLGPMRVRTVSCATTLPGTPAAAGSTAYRMSTMLEPPQVCVDEPQRHRWPALERRGACAHYPAPIISTAGLLSSVLVAVVATTRCRSKKHVT